MKKFVLSTAALACATFFAQAAVAGPKIWVSMGDDAYQLLRAAHPQAQSAESHEVQVNVPRAGMLSKAVGSPESLTTRTDRIHVLQVDEDQLHRLSTEVHEKLHRCGGYIVHASRAQARQSLQELRGHLAQAKLATALAPSYAIDNQAAVTPLLTQVQESQVLSTIQKLSDYQNRFYKTSHGTAASNDLFNTWKQMAAGRTDITVSQFAHKKWPQKSVILSIKGTHAPDEIVVIGGHLDSTVGFLTGENSRAPGADDDASGIASLQEVMRVLLAGNYKPKRTLQFMGYAAEEVGLLGSDAIAAKYKKQGKKVVGVMQLDMTNYQGQPTSDITLITDYTNAAQNAFVQSLASTYLPELTVTQDACGYACSDHASWTKRGYVASFPFESSLAADNKLIHTPNDTLAKSNNTAAHAVKFAKLGLSFAVELASDAPVKAAR